MELDVHLVMPDVRRGRSAAKGGLGYDYHGTGPWRARAGEPGYRLPAGSEPWVPGAHRRGAVLRGRPALRLPAVILAADALRRPGSLRPPDGGPGHAAAGSAAGQPAHRADSPGGRADRAAAGHRPRSAAGTAAGTAAHDAGVCAADHRAVRGNGAAVAAAVLGTGAVSVRGDCPAIRGPVLRSAGEHRCMAGDAWRTESPAGGRPATAHLS